MRILQAKIVAKSAIDREQSVQQMALFDDEGAPRIVPMQADTVAAPDALTSAQISGGESPTQAEHNAVQADLDALRTTVDTLIANLKTANVVAPS